MVTSMYMYGMHCNNLVYIDLMIVVRFVCDQAWWLDTGYTVVVHARYLKDVHLENILVLLTALTGIHQSLDRGMNSYEKVDYMTHDSCY